MPSSVWDPSEFHSIEEQNRNCKQQQVTSQKQEVEWVEVFEETEVSSFCFIFYILNVEKSICFIRKMLFKKKQYY